VTGLGFCGVGRGEKFLATDYTDFTDQGRGRIDFVFLFREKLIWIVLIRDVVWVKILK